MDAIDKYFQYLYSSNKDEFKTWAAHHGLSKSRGANFYFDGENIVDATKSNCPIISCVKANGTDRWGDALCMLKSYFNI